MMYNQAMCGQPMMGQVSTPRCYTLAPRSRPVPVRCPSRIRPSHARGEQPHRMPRLFFARPCFCAQPMMMQPGMMQPGMMQPGMMQPGMMQQGMMPMQPRYY